VLSNTISASQGQRKQHALTRNASYDPLPFIGHENFNLVTYIHRVQPGFISCFVIHHLAEGKKINKFIKCKLYDKNVEESLRPTADIDDNNDDIDDIIVCLLSPNKM
jgi:hypothetical protein